MTLRRTLAVSLSAALLLLSPGVGAYEALAFGTAVLYGISLVFEGFAGFTPFKLIALSLIPIFAAILLVRWRLARGSL